MTFVPRDSVPTFTGQLTPATIHPDILNRYTKMLQMHIQLNTFGQYGLNGPDTSFTHLLWMLKEIPQMTDIGKARHWLGFVQGVMISAGLTTVTTERDFTRPYFKG